MEDPRRCSHRRGLCAKRHCSRFCLCYRTVDRKPGSVQYVRLARVYVSVFHVAGHTYDHLGEEIEDPVQEKVYGLRQIAAKGWAGVIDSYTVEVGESIHYLSSSRMTSSRCILDSPSQRSISSTSAIGESFKCHLMLQFLLSCWCS